MKNLHIENSYKDWSTNIMWLKIHLECEKQYGTIFAAETLNRSYKGMYIEWYLHNIGYWLTLPFTKNEKVSKDEPSSNAIEIKECLLKEDNTDEKNS